ncbi:dolichyl pyrophosphate Man9GlcNAc2 alpha-1:3-glucosyltransferase-like isoform X2, partial [Dinothrombium tinctorium]
ADKPPLYGDYEAQRHWMEVTVNLEPKEWYKNSSENDLLYWGLDYPPLTAYHMFVCGKIAQLYNKSWVALNVSRGTHGYHHKLFMRSTVIVVDVLIYFTATIAYWISVKRPAKSRDKAIFITLSLLYPGLILIDHGHFQYNCVNLGLTLWAVFFLQEGFDIFASIAFCLALNYKQMSLYHALPFFSYLLGISMQQPSTKQSVKKLVEISFVVIFTFYLCWLPFLSDLETFFQVLKRLFPFERGLYEVRYFILVNQTVIQTLFSGQGGKCVVRIGSINQIKAAITGENSELIEVNSSLVFFLLSFQVHEKSILLVALAITTLLHEHSFASFWFCIISVFSLQPLLIKDTLMLPYYTITILFIIAFIIAGKGFGLSRNFTPREKLRTVIVSIHDNDQSSNFCLQFISSMMGCLFLSLSTNILSPPAKYPDLFAVLNAIFCCIHFLGFCIYYHYLQFSVTSFKALNGKNGLSKLKKKFN